MRRASVDALLRLAAKAPELYLQLLESLFRGRIFFCLDTRFDDLLVVRMEFFMASSSTNIRIDGCSYGEDPPRFITRMSLYSKTMARVGLTWIFRFEPLLNPG
jgi:hypothetical protein